MKAKTLMTMAVAGTLGLSTAAFAGFTPFSVNESGDVIQALKDHEMSVTSTDTSRSVSTSAALGLKEPLALADDGVYSDYYVVSWAPVMVESWDLYVIDADELAAAEMEFGVPTHELALLSTEDSSTLELALVPIEEMSDPAAGD